MKWNEECRTLLTLASRLGYSSVSDLARFLKQIKRNDTIIGLRDVA